MDQHFCFRVEEYQISDCAREIIMSRRIFYAIMNGFIFEMIIGVGWLVGFVVHRVVVVP